MKKKLFLFVLTCFSLLFVPRCIPPEYYSITGVELLFFERQEEVYHPVILDVWKKGVIIRIQAIIE